MHRQLPAGLSDQLEGQFCGIAAHNMLLASELKSILRTFEASQVPCAPLRGPALAERLYRDITARPMGDLDLLVRKEDLPGVTTILRDLGFRAVDYRTGFAQAFSYTLGFFKERHGWIVVEPHWTITYPPFVDRVDMERVWQRCVRGRVVGVETWVLAQEDLLLHLCLHLTHQDKTVPLLWFYELDRLLRQEQEGFDWSRFLSCAREASLEFLLLQVLACAKTLLTTPIPDQVIEQLALEPPRSGEGRLLRCLGVSNAYGRENLAVLLTLGELRTKLRYALALLFPSPEFMLIQNGLTRRRQLALAYVRRFCRLSWESLKGLLALSLHP
jgi:hypothetical protein